LGSDPVVARQADLEHQDAPHLVSFLLECPNCGRRPVDEFSYGGEVTVRPRSSEDERALFGYLYFKENVAGAQREWWFHSSGCREWFQAERDTRTNAVLWTGEPA
jgi:heterotetrameric sarcosine oxidase delta subunit